jgi:diguanylate cyclase (GGDEF)-like protein
MLPSEHKPIELEDILQELLAGSGRPTPQLLAGFVQRYPDFAEEILSFASEWVLQESIDESEVAHEIDETLSQAKAHTALKNALLRFDREITAEAGREVEPEANDSRPGPISTKAQERKIQRPTIFILGTDPQQCKELRNILQGHVADDIVTANNAADAPTVKESDTVIIASEEKDTGVLYRRLLNKLEEQSHRAELLSQLIRLFSSSLNTDELLERVVSKSTEVLGDTSFIVLSGEAGQLKLEAAFSTDRDRLVKMLVTTVKLGEQAIKGELLSVVLVRRESVLISNLPQANLTPEMRSIVDKHGINSLLAVPIQTKEAVLGAFISLASESRLFTNDDVITASAIADFTAIVLENAGLFAELQRSAITDSLTGVYNTRFFHEVLGRETARADRYSTPLSLLMIDIDTFKLVNDTFGHGVGNKVLTRIAKTLEETVRNTDFVFRCGGDEFGVVLPGTGLEGAIYVAEKILHRVETSEILRSMGYSGRVTVSIGLSEYRDGSHFETLVAEADRALYMAKGSSKNCAKAFKPAENV